MKICGNYKHEDETNYSKFLEAMGAPQEMIGKVMEGLTNVRKQKKYLALA